MFIRNNISSKFSYWGSLISWPASRMGPKDETTTNNSQSSSSNQTLPIDFLQESGIVELMVALNCPYINKSQSTESIAEWIQSIDTNKQDKKLLLQWIFQVTGDYTGSLTQSFLQLGIFDTEDECQLFLDGKMKKKSSQNIWKTLFSFLHNNSQVELTDEDCVEKKEVLDSFVDTLLTSINLRDQLDKPVPLLDYALEKELAKSKLSGSVPRSALETILDKVEEEKANLTNKLEERQCDEVDVCDRTEDDIRDNLKLLTTECDKLQISTHAFAVKYDAELAPVLASEVSNNLTHQQNFSLESEIPQLTPDIPHLTPEFIKVTSDMRKFLHGSNDIHQQIVCLQDMQHQQST